ncbi:MAG: PAS domain-containing protein [Bacteroidota bacterium]
MVPEIILEKTQQKFGQKIRYPKDCESLSREINKTSDSNISATTLSRIFNLRDENSKPTLRTLDIISEYIGFQNWEHAIKFSIDLAKNQENDDNKLTYSVNAQFEIIDCNEHFANALQYLKEELVGINILTLLDKNTKLYVKDKLEKLKKEENIHESLGLYIRKDGIKIYLNRYIKTVLKDGVYMGVTVELTNLSITPFINNPTPKYVFILDYNFVFLYNNIGQLGFDKSYLNRSLKDLVPEFEKTKFFELFHLCKSTTNKISFTERFTFGENDIRWYDYSLESIGSGVIVITTLLYKSDSFVN